MIYILENPAWKGYRVKKSDDINSYLIKLEEIYVSPTSIIKSFDNCKIPSDIFVGNTKFIAKSAINLIDDSPNLLNESDELSSMVMTMRTQNMKQKCLDETDIHRKIIMCRFYLSSNEYGPLLERYVKDIFHLNSAKDNTSGDASINGINVEIKVSLGDKTGQLSFVQLRPDHDIQYYIMLCYDLHHGELGEIAWLLADANQLYELIPEYGGYAHGTIKNLGVINSDNIYGNNHEYALRPNPTKGSHIKSRILWNLMLEKFQKNPQDIADILGVEGVEL